MGVQKFLKSAFKNSLAVMDAEEIRIAGEPIMAVIDETRSSASLGTGAMNTERNLVVQFPSGAFHGRIQSGMIVEARGEKWQVSSDSESIKVGQIATTITLNEPERRSE